MRWLSEPLEPGPAKVPPRLTVYFWIVKLLTTAMGEAASDYFVGRFDPVIVVILGFCAFVAALALQFRAPWYIAWTYWLAAAMVSLFGTMAADVAHVKLGIPYVVSTSICILALAGVFTVWSRTEHTLSIHSINTVRREAFYWSAALVTFALGTAAGDLTAITFNLGFFKSGILFALVFLIPAIGYWKFRMNPVLAFWFAYIVTRPLGASFADWFGKAPADGGLGWGEGWVALVLAVLIVGFVAYLSVSRVDDPPVPATMEE